jgi:hypothetical protein
MIPLNAFDMTVDSRRSALKWQRRSYAAKWALSYLW